MAHRPFIIWAPNFDEKSGGSIALHNLCNKLNNLGYEAFLWPERRTPLADEKMHARTHPLERLYHRVKSKLRNTYADQTFQRNESIYSGIAHQELIEDAIVVYPEIVSGNPLAASRVVRWFLFKPGHLTGKINFGPGELYFFYQPFFNDPAINPDATNLLRLRWIRSDVYKMTNFGERTGSCYLIKKGHNRTDINIPKNSIDIEKRSPQQVSGIFNQKKYFFCYDLYTMYCVYAAMSGCIPVVMPQEGLSKEQWRPNEPDRYGIAYGIDDENWALETRKQLFNKFKEDTLLEDQMVHEFARKCQNFFA